MMILNRCKDSLRSMICEPSVRDGNEDPVHVGRDYGFYGIIIPLGDLLGRARSRKLRRD